MQIAAAQLRLVTGRCLGKATPPWVVELAAERPYLDPGWPGTRLRLLETGAGQDVPAHRFPGLASPRFLKETALIPATSAHMIPGTPLQSASDLSVLPAHSVVLVRSEIRPSFRTAWTLTVMEDLGLRYWSSASWRARPTDEELFAYALEAPVLLYRPDERFDIGPLSEEGWVLWDEEEITVFDSLAKAQAALGTAGTDPRAAVLQQISPGSWAVHGRP